MSLVLRTRNLCISLEGCIYLLVTEYSAGSGHISILFLLPGHSEFPLSIPTPQEACALTQSGLILFFLFSFSLCPNTVYKSLVQCAYFCALPDTIWTGRDRKQRERKRERCHQTWARPGAPSTHPLGPVFSEPAMPGPAAGAVGQSI